MARKILLTRLTRMVRSERTAQMPATAAGPNRCLISEIQPLQDSRWAELVASHPRASVFHTTQWLEALQRTYGYTPTVFTTSPTGEPFENGIVACRISSAITGDRLVSLPFSDHCEPLTQRPDDEELLLRAFECTLRGEHLRYVETRTTKPLEWTPALYYSKRGYFLHRLDLSPDLDVLFANCNKSSTQRKILRAEREGLVYEEGQSDALLRAFWELHLLTRRRHRVPPQPLNWFQNLRTCFGKQLKFRVAFLHGHPVAAILTLRHKNTLVYKYGCSDVHFHNLGGVHLLLWRSIQEAKYDGLRTFDLGRSDFADVGLIRFKDRWGASKSTLVYSRATTASSAKATFGFDNSDWVVRVAKQFFYRLPDGVLQLAGRLLYRHIG